MRYALLTEKEEEEERKKEERKRNRLHIRLQRMTVRNE